MHPVHAHAHIIKCLEGSSCVRPENELLYQAMLGEIDLVDFALVDKNIKRYTAEGLVEGAKFVKNYATNGGSVFGAAVVAGVDTGVEHYVHGTVDQYWGTTNHEWAVGKPELITMGLFVISEQVKFEYGPFTQPALTPQIDSKAHNPTVPEIVKVQPDTSRVDTGQLEIADTPYVDPKAATHAITGSILQQQGSELLVRGDQLKHQLEAVAAGNVDQLDLKRMSTVRLFLQDYVLYLNNFQPATARPTATSLEVIGVGQGSSMGDISVVSMDISVLEKAITALDSGITTAESENNVKTGVMIGTIGALAAFPAALPVVLAVAFVDMVGAHVQHLNEAAEIRQRHADAYLRMFEETYGRPANEEEWDKRGRYYEGKNTVLVPSDLWGYNEKNAWDAWDPPVGAKTTTKWGGASWETVPIRRDLPMIEPSPSAAQETPSAVGVSHMAALARPQASLGAGARVPSAYIRMCRE